MKMTTMTIEYQVTRSRDYQSVRLGGAVQIEMSEGEDKKECFEKARRWLAGQINAAAEEELEKVLFGTGKYDLPSAPTPASTLGVARSSPQRERE